MHAIFVFCEGSHDIAFLGRVLTGVGGYSECRKKLQEFPDPLQKFLEQRLRQRPVQERPARGVLRDDPPVLELALENAAEPGYLWLFLNCQGQDQHSSVRKFLSDFAKLFGAPFGTEVHPHARLQGWSAVFFYDANAVGLDEKLTRFKARYEGVFGGLSTLEARSWMSASVQAREGTSIACDVGCFIFTSPGAKDGTLEDALLPILESEEVGLFRVATAFIDDHDRPECLVKRSLGSSRKKAIITAAAQFDHPSYSMAVFLRETKLLESETLRSNEMCQAIVKFFARR